jgi:predicted glycoside hydrolase/deacetylase ChbG (UPF0249 family)
MRQALTSLLVLLVMTGHAFAADCWAEKLGFPSGRRVLILYGAHMGGAYETNRPGQELLAKGFLQSVAVLPPCPWFGEFAKWCRENPGHDVGVSLSMIGPSQLYRWRLVSPRGDVPSLVDPDGYPWGTVLQFTVRAELEDVRREVRAQIDAARKAGIQPTHLTTDMGALLTRPDLTELYLGVAQEHWIPAVVPELTPALIDNLREEGFPLSEESIDAIRRYPLPKLDDLKFVPDTPSYEEKRDAFYRLVRELSPGITQLIFHPADQTKALQLISPRWQNRVWEAQLLLDPAVHQFLEDEQIILTNWIEIMARFELGDEFPRGNQAD